MPAPVLVHECSRLLKSREDHMELAGGDLTARDPVSSSQLAGKVMTAETPGTDPSLILSEMRSR